MDIERTMEFILQSQARSEVRAALAEERAARADARMDKADARMDRADARMDKAEARMARTDKRITAISKLVQQGMKMLVRIESRLDEVAVEQKALAAAQHRTQRDLQAFIKSLNNRRNGHSGA